MKAGLRRGASVAFGLEDRVAAADDVVFVFKAEVLTTEDAEAWRCCVTRVFTVLDRPSTRLLAAVVFVAVVEAESVDPAEGGRGACNEVVEARAFTVDLARVCAVVRGDCGLLVEGQAGLVGVLEEGRADNGGNDEDGVIIDLGRVSLELVVGMRRVGLAGSVPF